MKQIKVAFIGAGYMASEHARAFEALDGVVMAGITSRSRERAEVLAQQYAMPVFGSVSELFENTEADLVVVAVNEMQMREVAIQCFVFPWTVMLEKPAGYDLDDARSIIRSAQQSGALNRIFVALNRRGYSSVRKAKDILRDCEGPRFIRVCDQQDQSNLTELYNVPVEVINNYMFANSIHLVDYFRIFGRGEVVEVDLISPWTPGSPGWVIAKVMFSSGDLGLYEGIWNGGPGPWATTISTRDKYVEMRPLEKIGVQLKGSRLLDWLDICEHDIVYKPGLFWQANQAVRAAKGEATELATIGDAFASMELVAQIFSQP